MSKYTLTIPSLAEIGKIVDSLEDVVEFLDKFPFLPASLKTPMDEALTVLTAVQKALGHPD